MAAITMRTLKASKANVKKILAAADFVLSENGMSGRTFRVGGKTQSIGLSSEGFQVEDAGSKIYVHYAFSTSSHPTERDLTRKAEIEARAMSILAERFVTVARNQFGIYVTDTAQ